MLPALGAMAIEYGLPLLGSLLPQIVEALAGGRSEEEATELVEPKVQEMTDKLVYGGMPRAQAEAQARASLHGEVEKAMSESRLPPLAMAALSVVGAVAGHKLGGRIMAGTDVVPPKRPAKSPMANGRPLNEGAETVADLEPISDPGAFQSMNPLPRSMDPRAGALKAVAEDNRFTRTVGKEAGEIAGMDEAMAAGKGQLVGPFPGASKAQRGAVPSVAEGNRFDRTLMAEAPVSGQKQGIADALKMVEQWEREGVMPNPAEAVQMLPRTNPLRAPFPQTPR